MTLYWKTKEVKSALVGAPPFKEPHYLIVNRDGVWFTRKKDEVGWIWPWQRKGRPAWTFWRDQEWAPAKSLKAIDEFWDAYWATQLNKQAALYEDWGY